MAIIEQASPSTLPIASLRPIDAEFIVADAPGQEEYTRNMATAASTVDLANVLVGVRHVVLAVKHSPPDLDLRWCPVHGG